MQLTNTLEGSQPSDIFHAKWLESITHFSPSASDLVLDLGCGSGELVRTLRKKNIQAFGFDITPPKGDFFSCADLDQNNFCPQFSEGSVAGIFAFDILEHINSPWLFLSRIRTLLHPEGKLFLSTPNTLSWERFLRPQTWSGVQDPQHKHLFHPYSLKFLLSRCGFQVCKIEAPIQKLGGLKVLPFGGQLIVEAKK